MSSTDDQRPWERGTQDDRWLGYLDTRFRDPEIGEYVLRNNVGARSYSELEQLEARHVSAREITLAENGHPRSWDLDGLRGIHRHLFQDVYPWAGELRTVEIGKGLPFARHQDIAIGWEKLSATLRDSNLLRTIQPDRYPSVLSAVYNSQNILHPFREGNGRTNRAFLSALAGEAGYRVDWAQVPRHLNDRACEQGKAGDTTLLDGMFARITKQVDGQSLSGLGTTTRAPSDRGPIISTPPGIPGTTSPSSARPYRPPRGPATPGRGVGR